jgi:hypothetical protein
MNRCIALGLILPLAAAAALPAAGAQPASWELSPYRVRLIVAVEPGGSLSPQVAQDLPADLAEFASANAGRSWQLEVHSPPPELRQALVADIGAISAAELSPEALAGDKVLLVAVSRHAHAFRVQARELDVASGLWNAVVTHEVSQADQLAAAAQRALLAAFAPLARIESMEGGTATLKLRAGALLRRDRSPGVVAGAVFRPLVVKTDAGGKVQPGSGGAIPWTVLTATSTSGATLTCRLDTGLAGNAIPAYHPQRPRWALGVARPSGSTRLKLVSASDPQVPLEGCEILSQSSESTGVPAGERLGVSDASGQVTILPGATPVRLLHVRQGEQMLARVPLIPGLAAEATLALVDDRQRLEIERLLAEIEDEALDLAARREALITRTKAALKRGADAAASKLKDQLAALPGPERLTARLDQAGSDLKSAGPSVQAALQPRLDAVRKALEQLSAQKPLEQLTEGTPGEAKDGGSADKAGDKKSGG